MPSTISSVSADSILKELGRVWAELAQSSDANGQATLRACAMTFIVATPETQDAGVINETIAQLMHEHPSRAIVLRIREGREEEVSARVVAQCWMPFGSRQQICSEQIEISSTPQGLDEIYTTLLGLMVPDLPVVLWCWGGHDFLAMPEFKPLLELPDKIIVDSDNGFGVDSAALPRLQQKIAAGRNISDLNWARLTPWREDISHAFDTTAARGNASSYQQVEIEYGTLRSAIGPVYLAAWLRSILGHTLTITLTKVDEPCEIRSVRLTGSGQTLEFRADQHSTLNRSFDGQTTCFARSDSNDYDLLRQELRILGRDPFFEHTLNAVNELAAQAGLPS